MSAERYIERSRRKQSGPNVSYLIDDTSFGMMFQFKNYTYNPTASSVGTADFRSPADVSVSRPQIFVFPLPKQLQDNTNINVGGKEIGTLGDLVASGTGAGVAATVGSVYSQMAAMGAKLSGTTKDSSNNVISSSDAFNELIGDVMSGANFLARNGLAQISPSVAQGIDARLGETINPHQTLTFDGVALKQHSFSFELAPRSDKESKKIAETLHKMKKFALPKFKPAPFTAGGEDNAFQRGILEYPSICEIAFLQSIDDRFFYKFKPAMISNINVDYAPQGNSLLRGGRPAFINVNITLVEQAIWTQADYENEWFEFSDEGSS